MRSISNTVLMRAHSVRSPGLAFHKFIRIRVINDSKYVEIAQVVNTGTLMGIFGEDLLSIVPANEHQAVMNALKLVKV